MTIDKAIGILSFNGLPEEAPTEEDWRKAEKLGIEALKRIKKYRGVIRQAAIWRLPGETE